MDLIVIRNCYKHKDDDKRIYDKFPTIFVDKIAASCGSKYQLDKIEVISLFKNKVVVEGVIRMIPINPIVIYHMETSSP